MSAQQSVSLLPHGGVVIARQSVSKLPHRGTGKLCLLSSLSVSCRTGYI